LVQTTHTTTTTLLLPLPVQCRAAGQSLAHVWLVKKKSMTTMKSTKKKWSTHVQMFVDHEDLAE
jgi:hypothetical protein